MGTVRVREAVILLDGLSNALRLFPRRLNFFLAEVRQGFGPYLAVYLLTDRNWTEDKIGMVMRYGLWPCDAGSSGRVD